MKNPDLDLCQVENKIEASDYLKILHEVVEAQKDKRLGFSFGYYLNLNALGLIHRISLRTNSIRQAFLLLEDYLKANFPLVQIHKNQSEDHF